MADWKGKAVVGDWVRFRQNGRLVIGRVEYAEASKFYWQGEGIYQTDIGEVCDTSILEVRRG